MVKGSFSVQETAKRWGNSVRWVNQYALEGRSWAIPKDAAKAEKHRSGPKPKETSERSGRKDEQISTECSFFFADELGIPNKQGDTNVDQV